GTECDACSILPHTRYAIGLAIPLMKSPRRIGCQRLGPRQLPSPSCPLWVIEASPVRIGEIRDASLSDNNLFVEAANFVEAHRRVDILRREVDGFDLTTIGVGKIAARTANSATSVKYSHILCNASHFRLDLCRIETAAVKLVDKIQHFDRR